MAPERLHWQQAVRDDPVWRREWLLTAIARCRSLAALPAVHETEQFGPAFEQLLAAAGWLWSHHPDSRRDEAGLPDYVCVHPQSHRVLFAELKAPQGRVREAQQRWLAALDGSGAEVHVWRPADVEGYVRVIAGETTLTSETGEVALG